MNASSGQGKPPFGRLSAGRFSVSVQASNKSAVNSPVKPSAPVGPARMVLAVPDEPARGHWGDSNRITPGKGPVLRDEVAAVVAKQQNPHERLRFSKGELWVGADVFNRAHLENTIEGRLRLIDLLGHDVWSLPISDDKKVNATTGYRYFTLSELKDAEKMRPCPLIVVLDGPFQRVVEAKGLINVLAQWRRKKDDFVEEYQKECLRVDVLLKGCLEFSVDAVSIADDLSGERSPLIRPEEIQNLFLPFYTNLVSEIHGANADALFHSCGTIHPLVPMIMASGFDGLAAIQHRTNDLRSFKARHNWEPVVMAGIDSDILEADALTVTDIESFKNLVAYLASTNGLVLSSSTGLYQGRFFERIYELYQIADTVKEGTIRRP
jgi:hypothetical protein